MPKELDVHAQWFTFWQALELMDAGYRMRYKHWPVDDYAEKRNTQSGRRVLYRFHSSVDKPPYERLPWLTKETVEGTWYFARNQDRSS